MKLYADLHIHSCLSPCADDDMTPANICGMAHIKGLDVIAVTDHNTAGNLPAVQAAADHYGILLLPGLEICSREEVHLLGYFPTLEAAMMVGEACRAHLPKRKNVPSLFGNQYLMNEEDAVLGEEEAMLIAATDLSIAQVCDMIETQGGICVPAHINRGSNGLLVNLGMMPADIPFPLVEVARQLPVDSGAVEGRRVLHSSDGHQLGALLEREFYVEAKERSRESLFSALKEKSDN